MATANNILRKESNAVLLVTDQYATSKEEDVSTTNREVVQILTGAGRKVYSLVLEDTEEDRKCAEADGVELILPTPTEGDTRKPCLDWLTFDHSTRYPRLPQDTGWIVGHAGVTSRAAATIKEKRFPQANLSLVTQTIPEDTEKYKEEEKAMGIGKKEDSIRQDAENSDTVFSVGHRTHDHFTNTFRAILKDKRPVHQLFLPEPSKIFQETTVEYVESREKVVLLISRVNEVGKLKGLDFAAKALGRVAERSHERIQLRIRSVSEEEYQASMNMLQTSINSGKLIPTLLPHGTQEDICRDMKQAHLVLMPSRTEPFGLVGLEAMAAGVPVLISDQSGLATLINEVIPEFHHSVLAITGNDSMDVRQWADQIEKVLRMSKAEFSRAAELKQRLLTSRYWEKSHQCFLQACGGPGTDVQVHQPAQVHERKRDTDPTGETDESRKAMKKGEPPLLRVEIEIILKQVRTSLKTAEDMLNYATAKETLANLDITADDTYEILQTIKPTVKTIPDLLNMVKAIETLERIAKGIKVAYTGSGSVIFYLQCTDMSGLGDLWFMYKSGKLNDMLAGSLIREETLQLLCAESISVKTTISIEDFRKALVYILTSPAARGQPTPRLPQEYPLYQPHTHTTNRVLDVLHLDHTKLTRSSGKQHDMEMPLPTCTQVLEDSQDEFETRLANVQNAADDTASTAEDIEVQGINSVFTTAEASKVAEDIQHTTESPDGTDMHKLISELASLELEQQMGRPRRSSSAGSSGHTPGTSGSGSSRPYTPTGGQDTQISLNFLLAKLNTPAVMEDKAQQFDLYCQIGDFYRTKLHNLQSALQYYQNMLECSQELSEDTKQAKAYSRLGLTYDILGVQQEAYRIHKRALAIYMIDIKNETDICVAYKNLASSLALSGQVSDAKTNYESALAVAMETGNKAEQMDISCKLGDLHRKQLHEPQESLKYYTEMLALARDMGRKDKERQAYNRLGVACWDMQDNEAALWWFQKTLKMRQESGDKAGQITAYQNIAINFKALGKLDLARFHYQSAMTIAMERGNKAEQMDIYCELGDLHRVQLRKPQESLKYYTEMLALARDLGRKDRESLAYNRLGLTCRDMQDYEAALKLSQKVLKMSQESGDKTEEITAHKNIAVCHKALGKVDLARSHYQSAMTIAMETGNKTEQITAHRNIADFYKALGNLDLARSHSAMTIAMETGNKTKQIDIYCKLGDLHREQLHEPQESHKYYTEMLALASDLGRKDSWERLAYNKLGVAHYDVGEYETALKWNHKLLKMSQESGDKTAQITAHRNIAFSYEALGNLDLARSYLAMTIAMKTGNKTEQMDIYCKLGDLHRKQLHEPQKSLKYYTEMLALARDLGRKDRERLAYNKLGVAHYDVGEHETALDWSHKFMKMSQESGDKTGEITAHKNIAGSYKALGKLDLARSHYQSALTIAMETGNKQQQDDIAKELANL